LPHPAFGWVRANLLAIRRGIREARLEILDRLADQWWYLLRTTSGDDPYSRPECAPIHRKQTWR